MMNISRECAVPMKKKETIAPCRSRPPGAATVRAGAGTRKRSEAQKS
jgi:hypothetical protein